MRGVMPQISVLMAVYNGVPYVQWAIESILAQTFTNFEYIIVNDASTDDTLELCQRYSDPRIHIIDLPENVGLTKALNKAIEHSTGAFLARQDADDVSKPDRFARQIAFFEENPEYLLIGTAIDMVDSAGVVKYTEEYPASDEKIRTALQNNFGNPITHGSAMWRREVMEQVGVYREGFRTSQDYDYWLRMADVGKIGNLPLPAGYEYRTHSGQMSYVSYHRMQAEWALIDELAEIRHKGGDDTAIYEAKIVALNEKFANFTPSLAERRRVKAEFLRNQGVFDLQSGNYISAAQKIARAFLAEPTNPNFWRAVRGRLGL